MALRPGSAPEGHRPHLRVVRDGEEPSSPRSLRSVLVPVSVVLILAIFAVAALQAYVGQEGLRLARLERQVQQAEERYALLRAQLAESSSPDRIERRAAELGLVPADPVFLPAPRGVGEAGSADGSDGYASKHLLTGVP